MREPLIAANLTTMVGTLSFTLPEEQDEFELATNAHKYLAAIQDFDDYLRSQLKYCELPDHEHDTLTRVREKFAEYCHGLPR